MYIAASFFHMNSGACYPSDCLLSIVPIVLVILTHYLGALVNQAADICPSCDGGFCYYTPSLTTPAAIPVLRQNFNWWNLHGASNIAMVVAGFVLLTILVYPL
jgi:uncharacterized membrane protein